MHECSKSVDSGKRDGRREERRSIDSVKTQPSYFIYRLVGSQPGYAFEVSRAIVRHTREGKRRRRGEGPRSRRGRVRVRSVLLRRAMVRGTAEECIHRLCIGATATTAQETRASYETTPFFLVPSSFLSRTRPRSSVRSFSTVRFFFSFSGRCVARASGPISSWTSHHSITLSMPVRPCLSRAHTVHVCRRATDNRAPVSFNWLRQYAATIEN